MVSDGHVLEFSLTGVYETPSNKSLNIFQYQVDTEAPFNLADYGQEICNSWYERVTSELQPLTSTLCSWQDVVITNLSTPAEFWLGVPDTPVSGLVSGDTLPPYASWGFILRRTTKITRNGAKRFWGVPESMQVNGIPTAGAGVLLPSLADFLGAQQFHTAIGTPPIEFTLTPEIVRKNALGEMTLHQHVYDGQFRAITTQNTRKFGRGM